MKATVRTLEAISSGWGTDRTLVGIQVKADAEIGVVWWPIPLGGPVPTIGQEMHFTVMDADESAGT